MEKFLRLKHWQIFLPVMLLALPFPSPFIELFGIISTVFFICWIYSVGYYGQDKIIDLGLKKLNLRFFKINLIVVPLVVVIRFILPYLTFLDISKEIDIPLILDISLRVCSYLAFVYIVVFASKVLSMIELKSSVTFHDYLIVFLLIVFFPFGIWYIQPKVNDLIGSKTT